MEHKIKFYPVGNADCTLIKLGDGTTILIDCFINNEKDNEGKALFDVKKDLLDELAKDSYGHPLVNLFINTHPHDDHCTGFEDNFYHGYPADYDDEKNDGQIVIGEMWVPPMDFDNNIGSKDAIAIRKEAKRRRDIYNKDSSYQGEEGNYLHMIGYDKDKNFDSRYGYVPGTLVNNFNGIGQKYIKIFIHAPFKENVQKGKQTDDKNETSIVMQLKFYMDDKANPVCKFLTGGDAEHDVWQQIIDNNKDDVDLEWHIFQAPHHCSWTFFNDHGKDDVLESATEILNKQIGSPYIVASSEKIMMGDPTPPSYPAKKEYLKKLDNDDQFRNTAINKDSNGNVQPIVFKIGEHGKELEEYSSKVRPEVGYKAAPRAGNK